MTDRTLVRPSDLDALDFDKGGGLLPVLAQDAGDGRVLMVAFGNREALEKSLETGWLHFWSRSRGELWKKGETSGNVLEVVSLHADCDGDTVLARVRPAGPACHTGEATCFGDGAAPQGVAGGGGGDHAEPTEIAATASRSKARPASADTVLSALDATLARRQSERPEGSYTVRLLDDVNLRLKKLGEETAELVMALATNDASRATEEAADLIYHTLVALRGAGVELDDVMSELERRAG